MFRLLYINGIPFLFMVRGGALMDVGGRWPATLALLQGWYRR